MTQWEDYNEEVPLPIPLIVLWNLRGFEKETIQKCLTKEPSREIHLDLENEKSIFYCIVVCRHDVLCVKIHCRTHDRCHHRET